MATTNGISLAPENLAEEVAQLMSQELPYTVFDTDTEVAVASVLNAKLEFDETLLTENVVLSCGAPGERGEGEGVVQDVEMQKKDSEEEDDSSHYFNHKRTVVCEAASSTEVSGLPSTQSISQLDGADGGSESDESDAGDGKDHYPEGVESEAHTNHNTPTKQLTVALKRLESIYTVSTDQLGTAETTLQENTSPSGFGEGFSSNFNLPIENDQVGNYSETSQNLLLDSSTGYFVSTDDSATVYPNNYKDNKDETSSTDSAEGFKDDLTDPDYFPEPQTPKSPISPTKNVVLKPKGHSSNLKIVLPPQRQPQLIKPKLILSSQPSQAQNVPAGAATFSAVPRPVTSPIIINGLKALPINTGATRGKPIAIRLAGSQSQLLVPNQAAAASTDSPPTPAAPPQVLLVNRQGQVLVKDPRSNTYQQLSTSSPAYNKISQIAKILHSNNTLQRALPRVTVKSHSGPSVTNVPPAGNHTTTTRNKIIVRVVPVKNTVAPAPSDSAPVSAPTVANRTFSNLDKSMSQSIIDTAIASHDNTTKTKPIILNYPRGLKARQQRPSLVRNVECPDPSEVADSERPSAPVHVADDNLPPNPAAASGPQVSVKRRSSASHRPSRKRSKMDFLRDLPYEPEEEKDFRYVSTFCCRITVISGL